MTNLPEAAPAADLKPLPIDFKYAERDEVLNLVAEGLRGMNTDTFAKDKLQFIGGYTGPYKILEYLLDRYFRAEGYEQPRGYHWSPQGGCLNVDRLIDCIKEAQGIMDRFGYLRRVRGRNRRHYEQRGVQFRTSQNQEDNLIGIATLDAAFRDGDPDPYETAGGYRTWEAQAGENVYLYLQPDLTVKATFKSHCLEDHYNNNFYGVSTGNGTKRYQLGERTEKRSIKLGRDFLDGTATCPRYKTEFKYTVSIVDIEKALRICDLCFPQLTDVINQE